MEVHLLEPRGFCRGVQRAVELLDETLAENGPPVYVYHEIVHNTAVVNSFHEKGAIFVETLDEVPTGSVILYSAHGVSPAVREAAAERNLKQVDATCPLVAKLHEEAKLAAAENRSLFLIGYPNHDEVVGILGEAPENIFLIASEEDARNVSPPSEARMSVLTQTTVSSEFTEPLIAILAERFPQLDHQEATGMCDATRRRQQAVRDAAQETDLLLVVGSANSSNSRRLQEIAAEKTTAQLVDGPDDINLSLLTPNAHVAITAGASVPEAIVQACVAKVKREG